ncbi:GNAT family N-acetyltransferase [Umboniibacter marinipuniceus]|uniref:ElaA protein n=1 Tax=Umboniibacter marinipuniceus TaxID=569599 RepID=A0A3M0A8B5_9GAMM|nr:GNAT family N-acetyltransferase [Umboniibacter marinipuniceus]RMA81333.1 ElaA protein [Umboniibacter marinipuniceus]
MEWHCQSFAGLSAKHMYQILKLRQDVFVVEQDCAFPDIDGIDPDVWHFYAVDDDEVVAYTRLIDAGISYPGAISIGRVVVAPAARGNGFSYELMDRSILQARTLFGNQPIKIGAQSHLAGMYGKLGFAQSSDEYLEDGIPHIEMTLEAQ